MQHVFSPHVGYRADSRHYNTLSPTSQVCTDCNHQVNARADNSSSSCYDLGAGRQGKGWGREGKGVGRKGGWEGEIGGGEGGLVCEKEGMGAGREDKTVGREEKKVGRDGKRVGREKGWAGRDGKGVSTVLSEMIQGGSIGIHEWKR